MTCYYWRKYYWDNVLCQKSHFQNGHAYSIFHQTICTLQPAIKRSQKKRSSAYRRDATLSLQTLCDKSCQAAIPLRRVRKKHLRPSSRHLPHTPSIKKAICKPCTSQTQFSYWINQGRRLNVRYCWEVKWMLHSWGPVLPLRHMFLFFFFSYIHSMMTLAELSLSPSCSNIGQTESSNKYNQVIKATGSVVCPQASDIQRYTTSGQ